MTPPRLAALLAALLLASGMLFQSLLAAGLPLGRAAWGGKHRVLPPRLRWGSLAAVPVLGIAAWTVLARTGLLAPGADSAAVRIAAYLFAGFFALNTLGNLASGARVERYLMAPVTALLSACFLVAALS